jgi:hypothetical protein
MIAPVAHSSRYGLMNGTSSFVERLFEGMCLGFAQDNASEQPADEAGAIANKLDDGGCHAGEADQGTAVVHTAPYPDQD